ncbi:organic hydroperoxide reductase OsmC/OhrA [Natronospira proteinivora]|uniref:Organic hydroperoxide reductase OsmC/OhrA n=1 Tax=Natronospira proteinivora TaxID=1807133 RepID=A0ABT1G7P7_9GAMM|nr:OsmC family protein [Natronospira proteinivora]MCP1727246.1 organic hydroperoxide reductase OsmC/OhrA [Natronospira proteinivora]
MSNNEIEYRAHLAWVGNLGHGTAKYDEYGRNYRVKIAGKPDMESSAGTAFRGDPSRHDPEDHFLAAVSGCHMLSYLALCAKHRIVVTAYEDEADGTLKLAAGGGYFEAVVLHPVVTITREEDRKKALRLHETAHKRCFIANSCSVPIAHEAGIRVQPSTVLEGGARS